ncbi:hypothetical protein E2C01_076790 [Portunus trituberculatus]|uniref:Uncharacterized protein n=1 Tax=Portunus trituberculatus TaxID=210409 RepID=A0A5B7IPL6_PORTR|nr:hypothetical protein [Portunus trituberculatus]
MQRVTVRGNEKQQDDTEPADSDGTNELYISIHHLQKIGLCQSQNPPRLMQIDVKLLLALGYYLIYLVYSPHFTVAREECTGIQVCLQVLQ